MACIFVASLVIYFKHGVPSRLNGISLAQNMQLTSKEHASSCLNLLPHSNYNNNICQRTQNPKIAIIGDSHAGHLFEGFLHSGINQFNQVMAIGRGSCLPVLGIESAANCKEVIEAAVQAIEALPSIDTILLSAYYKFDFPLGAKSDLKKQNDLFLAGYSAIIDRLSQSGRQVYFVEDVPALDFNPEACLKRPLRLPYSSHSKCEIGIDKVVNQRLDYQRLINELVALNPNLTILRTMDVFCDRGICRALDDGVPLYKDFNHLSSEGSLKVATSLISQIVPKHGK